MSKLVLHLFHDDSGAQSTVPALAERIFRAAPANGANLELYVFGPAESLLASSEHQEFNSQIDDLVKLGVRVTACVGLAQKFGSEERFRRRGIALESAAVAFPRFAVEGATVVSF
jgi:hypothetical protein